MLAALIAMTAAAVLVGTSGATAATATCAGLGTDLASLCVESSTAGAAQPPYATNIAAGQRITEFQWLVNEDSTGDPTLSADNVAKCLPARAATANPAIYANAGSVSSTGIAMADCPWPSIHSVLGHSTVVATGTDADASRLAALSPGKYLLSVTAADFKIDGIHFEVGAGHTLVSVNDIAVGQPGVRFVVLMNPLPKKTATVRVHVYNDNASTNGQWDGQTETLVTCAAATPAQRAANCGGANVRDPNIVGDPATDMSGFSVQIADVLAGVTTDVFGNPLCTEYRKDRAGNIVLDAYGSPTPLTFGGTLAGTESTCISDHYGDIVIPNMGPNRYAATVVPPDPRTHNGAQWVQTTTLEGGHDWDTWNIEGGTGFDTELIVGGERVPPVAHGFVKLTHNDAQMATMPASAYYDAANGFNSQNGNNGSLTGRLMVGRAYTGSGGAQALAGTNLTNSKSDGPIEDGLISISCIATCDAPTDSTVWTGRAHSDGTFTVTGLQTGDYTVAFWDQTQNYILAVMQYSVVSGQTTDAGDVLLPGWFTDLQGSVFVDTNANGVRDPSEHGVPDFGVTIRTRGNSLQDQGAATALTDDKGDFDLGQGYPLGQFLVFEAYNPRFKTTGITYHTDNDSAHTVATSQVDFDFLPIIGLSAKIDVGVLPYDQGENGGIAGTVTYDVTRNELDPAYSAQEDYQPGVAGIPMQLWKTKKVGGAVQHYPGSGAAIQMGISRTSGGECERPDNTRGTDALADASQDCKPFDYYVTESWTRPTGCMALDVNGNKLLGELALPDSPSNKNAVNYHHDDPTKPDCIESPMNGFQIGGDGSVDGNYALTNLITSSAIQGAPAAGSGLVSLYTDTKDVAANWGTLTPADYLVEAVNPTDELGAVGLSNPDADQGGSVSGTVAKKVYRFTDETSINVFTGDTYVPQDGYTGPNAASDPGITLKPYNPRTVRNDVNSLGAGTVAKCAGSMAEVKDDNGDLASNGGSPYLGQQHPVCDAKVVKVVNGRSVNPTFFVYTDVPIPSKFFGLINDDLNVNVDRRSILLGEVAPVSNGPVGVYDENGNWKFTAHSDVNGFYEVLLPSMDTYNCPLPAGPCPNMYRLVGNDPGTLNHRNLDYNPQFRTIATEFQAWAGVVHPVDQAPTHQGITIEGPAAQFGALSLCQVNDASTPADSRTPEIFAIDKPYFDPAADTNTTYHLQGAGFGAAQGRGALLLDSTPVTPDGWTDGEITFTVPGSLGIGGHQLAVRSDNGISTVNGITFHRLAPSGDTSYYQRNDVYEVRARDTSNGLIATDDTNARVYTPMHDAWDTFTDTPAGFSGTDAQGIDVSGGRAIQRAVEAAHQQAYGRRGDNLPKLIVIYPNTATNYAPHNANAAYFENVVLHGKVALQGVGPGGVRSATDIVNGTTLDASLFWAAAQASAPGTNLQIADGAYSDDWRTFANGLNRAGTGPAELPEGEAVLAIAETANQWANLTTRVRGDDRENLLAAASRQKAGVDGMVITGGDQQGNPGNINTAPGATGQGSTAPTNPGPAQGGAITLDQYVRDFTITNNLIQSNGGTYGTVRVGSPDLGLSAADQDNHNERLNVANNRFLANGGTNLAGALGIYAGADLYKVTGNDFCGNFSAEYGGALSHYGSSAGGTIRKNRIYYNQGYDEGGGIMVAGNLPPNNSSLSLGAGGSYGTVAGNRVSTVTAGVTIDGNQIISNQSNDDGGGVRFLMAGNFPYLLTNNVIANNLSTHEGAGIALDDAPNVTIVDNTVVKNITTATAATNAAIANDVRPANPAGLSTGGNSTLLQATLSNAAPNWSKPLLVNNLFADNRAGWAELPTALNFNTSAIRAIGGEGDTTAIQRWDIGVSAPAGLCNSYNHTTHTCNPGSPFGFDGVNNTTNSSAALINTDGGASYAPVADNIAGTLDGTTTIGFTNPVDFVVDSLGWRTNTNVSFPVIVAHLVPFRLLADYHLLPGASTLYAVDKGTNPVANSVVPSVDIDGQVRPQGPAADRGADEIRGLEADLSITKTDGVGTITAGSSTTYTIVVANSGPDAVTNAVVTDTVPASLTGVTWTCAGAGNGTCAAASGSGSINSTVTLPSGASATFRLTGTVASGTTGSIVNTASVSSTVADPTLDNNTATDTDVIPPPAPTIGVLDNFNRANANNLGGSWRQATILGAASLQVNASQASAALIGNAFWNGAGGNFAGAQAAGFTISNGTFAGDSILLKGTGNFTLGAYVNHIRVRFTGSQVLIETTTNGFAYITVATLSGTVVNGSTVLARADAAGHVDVWINGTWIGAGDTLVTGGGRVGIQLPTGARADDFRGGAA
jgi:uncharacterized repeat protein (TIGR01451 family)